MKDKVFLAMAGALAGAGGFAIGFLVRQPEINKLQGQIEQLQEDIEQLEEVVVAQNNELSQMLLKYETLKVYQFSQRRKLRQNIEDELVCQYAAADYLTLLTDFVSLGTKMNKEDLNFYNTYSKMLSDNNIDDNELAQLKPFIYKKYAYEIGRLEKCDMNPIFNRIRNYKSKDKGSAYGGMFNRNA